MKTDTHPRILIIDDEPIARDTLEALLSQEPFEMYFATDGLEGFSRATEVRPDVILLDVMMPLLDGFAVCRAIRHHAELGEVPILLISALDDRDSRLAGLNAGADDFITKPFDRLDLLARLRSVTRLNRYRRLAEQRHELAQLNAELLVAYDKTIEGWSSAMDLRDKETDGHTHRVTEKAIRLARLLGINEDELKHLWRGAMLHDIGKLGIPDSILLKEGPLTPQEWDIMRQHPIYAYRWLSPIEYLRPALNIPYCHHEKWDGSGYPRKLKGQDIPYAARIFAIIDVWDAITSDRPYRKAMSFDEARRHIESQVGKHFDPQVAAVFLANIRKF